MSSKNKKNSVLHLRDLYEDMNAFTVHLDTTHTHKHTLCFLQSHAAAVFTAGRDLTDF